MMAKNPVTKLAKIKAEAAALLDEKGPVLQDPSQASRSRRTAHFWVLVVKSFLRNRCPVRASALAYTTLLALIPLLAVVISVSTSLLKSQGEEPIEKLINKLVENIAPQLGLIASTNVTVASVPSESQPAGAKPNPALNPQGQQEVARRIMEYVGNVRSGTLGITGVISLILVAILLLSTIETTFNDIWGVARGRSWFARVVQYWAAITLGPLILIVAVGLTSGPFFSATHRLVNSLPWVGQLLAYVLSVIVPFLVLTGGFALFYSLMPNTKVHWRAALTGGAVGGCLWQGNNLFNVIYVSKVVAYSKIYGSFSMVPLFLIGMYFSWLILLFGAQVAYAFQNRQAYLQEKLAEGVHQQSREFIALRVMTLVGQRFQRGEKPPATQEISERLAVPSSLATQVLQILVKAGLLNEVGEMEMAYAPSRPLPQINCQDILQALRASPGHELMTREDEARGPVRQEFDRIRQAEQAAAGAITLQELVNRLPQPTA